MTYDWIAATSEDPIDAPPNEWWIETAENELIYFENSIDSDLTSQPIAGPSNTSHTAPAEATGDHTHAADQQDGIEPEAEVAAPRGFARRPTLLNPWE